jgi:hypothetical protein
VRSEVCACAANGIAAEVVRDLQRQANLTPLEGRAYIANRYCMKLVHAVLVML